MLKSEQRIYNFGYINGFLSSISRVNDKTNNGYEFSLEKKEKKEKSTKETINEIFNPICKSFKLERINNPKEYLFDILLNKWFFEFQEKKFDNISLIDKGNDFSLSDSEWKQEWLEEFITLLLTTVESNKVHNLKVEETKGFYVCDSDEIIFENNNEIYHLHLSVSD